MKNTAFILLSILVMSFGACDMFTYKPKNKEKKNTKEISVNANGDTVHTAFRKDGSIKSIITIKDGLRNGPSFSYYDNGNIQFEINYKDSYKDSITKYYYENGEIYRTTYYKKGLKNGLQTYYHENGKLKATVPYNNNKVLQGTKEYSKSGKPIKDYPKITVTPIDNLAFENRYELQISLKPKKKKVSFYFNKKIGDEYYRIPLKKSTKAGIATERYNIRPGQSIMEKLQILAEFKSKRGIPVVLTRTYNLTIENRNY